MMICPLRWKSLRHRALRGDAAAVLGDEAADFRGGAVAVVGAHLDQHGHAVRPVNLVGQILEVRRLAAAGAFLDRPLDVVARHVGRAALEQHHPQARVHVRVAAAQLGGDGDFLAQLREDLPALRVHRAFEVLDLCPFAMS